MPKSDDVAARLGREHAELQRVMHEVGEEALHFHALFDTYLRYFDRISHLHHSEVTTAEGLMVMIQAAMSYINSIQDLGLSESDLKIEVAATKRCLFTAFSALAEHQGDVCLAVEIQLLQLLSDGRRICASARQERRG